ncbi:hypothetical protein [Henriciella aquimarina]|uniref:hypothetical protein n=1 Tax=Henriciella aquimarina TaxID=545261 RepID=UPI000A050678|nr:hypothetical protein [Henriciella aquimarina]
MGREQSGSRSALKDKLKTIDVGQADEELVDAFNSLADCDAASEEDARAQSEDGSEVDHVRTGGKPRAGENKQAN